MSLEVPQTVDDYCIDEEVVEIIEYELSDKPQSLQELLETDDFFNPISNPVEKSPAELLLLTLKFSLKHRLSLTAFSDLNKLLNCTYNNSILPETRYKINKILNTKENVEYHALCQNCYNYIGTFNDLQQLVECEVCESSVNTKNPSNPCYFTIIDPSDRISECINAYSDFYADIIHPRSNEVNHITDIFDGQMYKKFVKNLSPSENVAYVSATINTDGAPVFESSKYSVWPIYLQIHQLPYEAREKNIITCGLWFGKNKPEMLRFLKVFVDRINQLNQDGISCTIQEQEMKLKLYILIACVDTVARAPMNGTLQFNAYYGCDWCLHPGEWYDGCIRYPYLENIEDGTQEGTIEYSRQAIETGKPMYGVKYPCPLINLKYFDIIKGFVPEYMHCMLEGVIKQFTQYILNFISKNDLDIIDTLILRIKAPNQIVRLSRSIYDRKDWKAREWENWALYYSIPLIKSRIPEHILDHWSLLTNSLYILLKNNISYNELNDVNVMLHKFVANAQILYGKEVMTYNVHQLCHITDSVYHWGPLWAHSAFPFESANHQLLNAIYNAKGVNEQIIRYLDLQHCSNILEKHLYGKTSDEVELFCENVFEQSVQKSLKLKNVTYFGKQKYVNRRIREEFQLHDRTLEFRKIVKDRCLYTSCEKENNRSCNSYAKLKDGRYIKIRKFLIDMEDEREMCVCNIIETRSSLLHEPLKIVSQVSDTMSIIDIDKINVICIFIDVTSRMYICAIPNLLYY